MKKKISKPLTKKETKEFEVLAKGHDKILTALANNDYCRKCGGTTLKHSPTCPTQQVQDD